MRTILISALFFLLIDVYFADATPATKIGVILPLSGPVADYGIATRNGIELARSDNEDAHSKVDFIYEDSQDNAKVSVTAFQKLSRIDGVKLIFVWGSAPAEAIAPIAEAASIPTLAVTVDPVITRGREYVIRYCAAADAYAKPVLAYLRARGYQKLGVIKSEASFFENILGGLRSQLRQGESLELVASVSPSETDFRTVVSKLKTRQYDAIGVFLFAGPLSQFFVQSAALHFSAPLFGTNTFENPDEVRASKGAMTGAVYATLDANAQFQTNYKNRFGNDKQYMFAAQAYDFATLMGQIFNGPAAPQTNRDVLNALAGIDLKSGVSGHIKYLEDVNGKGFDFPVILRRVEQEKFVTVDRQ